MLQHRYLTMIFVLFATYVHEKREQEPPLVVATAEERAALQGGARFLVDGKVSALTGALCLHRTDLVEQGAQPIVIDRTYFTSRLAEWYGEHPSIDRPLPATCLMRLGSVLGGG